MINIRVATMKIVEYNFSIFEGYCFYYNVKILLRDEVWLVVWLGIGWNVKVEDNLLNVNKSSVLRSLGA